MRDVAYAGLPYRRRQMLHLRAGLATERLAAGNVGSVADLLSVHFYEGGDLAGLLQHIEYIRGLGTTSIWLTPSFKNKAVQLEDGPSAGYHGYWVTDFTQIDPHLGTNADLRALVDAAHALGMKVYFDIITNHTADVIGYQQGARTAYVSKDERPYRTAAGKPDAKGYRLMIPNASRHTDKALPCTPAHTSLFIILPCSPACTLKNPCPTCL